MPGLKSRQKVVASALEQEGSVKVVSLVGAMAKLLKAVIFRIDLDHGQTTLT